MFDFLFVGIAAEVNIFLVVMGLIWVEVIIVGFIVTT